LVIVPEPWTLLLFPAVVAVALAALRFLPYRRLGDPVERFRASIRPPRLRWALTGVLLFGGAIYITLVAVRVALAGDILSGIGAADTSAFLMGLAAAGLFCLTLVCELIVVAHLFFYLRLCRDGARHYRLQEVPELPSDLPKVALLIPTCDELPETLERPLQSLDRIRYPNCRVILVENSRDPVLKEVALRMARAYGIDAVDLANRGTKAAALNDVRPHLDADTKYVAVLDADQRLSADMVSELVALLEADPSAGWIQTTQIYEDTKGSLLRTAAAQQLLVLYDSALQGKDVRGVCPMLGTNFVVRLDALDAVGGWEESYVNEDTATSYAIQLRGLKGRYRERVYASMEALWRQQRRWAHANSKLAFTIMRGFFRPGRRPFRVVADYLALTSYELLAFVIAVLAIVPSVALVAVALLVSNGSAALPAISGWQWVFASLYPFHVLLLFFPHVNMGLRGYPIRNLVLFQGLVACLGPVYLQGVKRTVVGQPAIFESPVRTIPAGRRSPRYGWFSVPAPQAIGFVLFVVLGSLALAITLRNPASPFTWIVTFWAAFHAVCTGHYALFAQEERRAVHAPVLVRRELRTAGGEAD
jgi:cellulose synthase/poly-beta-1,6-N-acetylglucosamine synthase-like glycosyltransferase